MEEKKSNKKRLVVAIALLALIVVASVVTTVVLVLAAQEQTVKSNINVTYNVQDVSATIDARYGMKYAYVGSGDYIFDHPAVSGSGIVPVCAGLTSVSFDPSYDGPAKEISPSEVINLSSSSDYVIFEYKFTNNSQEEALKIDLSYEDSGDSDENVFVKYMTSESAVTDFSEVGLGSRPYTFAGNWTDVSDTAVTVSGEGVPEDDGTGANVWYVYVLICINDTNKSAAFSGGFVFDLARIEAE